MTRLDQAFIKVYTRQGEASPATPDPPEPRPAAEAPADRPCTPPHRSAPGVSTDGVAEVLQATASRIGDLLPLEQPHSNRSAGSADEAATGSPEDAAVDPSEPVHAGSTPESDDPSEVVGTPDEPDRPAAAYRIDPAAVCQPALDRPVPAPHVRLPGVDLDEGSPSRDAVDTEPTDQTFQPLLQVDQFAWPALCCRLAEAAAEELDRLADALVGVLAEGKRVVAVGACRRGEGATTLVLCAARRLAQRGLNVLMADANLSDAQLAGRLGLAPECGWEDVLTGRLLLDEVVVESVGDRLALLPICRRRADDDTPIDDVRLAESIQALAAHYDLVLIDTGPLEELGVAGASLARGLGSLLDAVALVHHPKLTPLDDLDQVSRCLAATRIMQVGVVENFAHS